MADGRGAFVLPRSCVVRHGGAIRSENAGMSSEIPVRNRDAENPRFPPHCKSAEGESALRVFRANLGVTRWTSR